jgi:hypothetical protein
MNKVLFTLLLFFISFNSHSQIDIGIKGGLNLNFSKEANTFTNFNITNNSENGLGFHFGVMAEFEIPKLGIALRPEVLYTNLKQDHIGLFDRGSHLLTIQKIDIPILVAINITGPLRLLVGPSLQFQLDNDLDFEDFREIDSNSFYLNAQIGLGLKFERFDVDLRWERGLSESESNFVSDNFNVGVEFDSRPNQLILGVTYRFGLN